MKPWHTLVVSLAALAAFALPPFMPPARAAGAIEVTPAAPAVRSPDVTVTVKLKSGFFKTVPAENLDVFLCHAAAAHEIEAVRATGKLLAQQIGDFRGLASDLPFMKGRAGTHLQQKGTTDAGGKCFFRNVPPGEYIVFAGYSDAPGAGYWLVPVTVEAGKPRQLELTTKGMNEFFKKP